MKRFHHIESGRTWFDDYFLDPVVGWGTGHANVVTFGATDWLQRGFYGDTLADYNQNGWAYNIGTATGIDSIILMGHGGFTNGGRLAATGALRLGLQGWTIGGGAQRGYNVLHAQDSLSDGLGFLPTIG